MDQKESRRSWWLLAGAVFLLVCGCNLPAFWTGMNPFGGITVAEHPEIRLASDKSLFEQADCGEVSYGRRQCEPESVLGKLGCSAVIEPPDALGGLDPDLPVMACRAAFTPGEERLEPHEYLYNEGCLMPGYIRLVVWQEGSYHLLKNSEDLKSVYAPIETPEEAFSYAIAATGLEARFDLEPERNFRYHVSSLEETYVEEIEDGYRVHLFHYRLCGCGPHTTSAAAVDVGRDGSIQVGDFIPLFEDPEQDGLCVD
ncbi:MAG: hypothetical protein HPY59_02385 [Anaerolineae bacterium]|nr:hypothetical protein [Anaerolineae bacterium]